MRRLERRGAVVFFGGHRMAVVVRSSANRPVGHLLFARRARLPGCSVQPELPRAHLVHIPAKKPHGLCNRPAVVEFVLRSLISASDQGSPEFASYGGGWVGRVVAGAIWAMPDVVLVPRRVTSEPATPTWHGVVGCTLPGGPHKKAPPGAGLNDNINIAMKEAVREAVELLQAKAGVTAAEAYAIASMGVDFRVAEAVDSMLLIYGVVPKKFFKQTPRIGGPSNCT